MSLLEIRQLQEDMADMRKAIIQQYERNKELSDMNELLRSANLVLENQLKNAQRKIKAN